MPTNWVVEHLDVVEDIRGRCYPIGVNLPFDSLLLNRTEETFGHRIVVAVHAPTHARHHVVCLQKRLPIIAGELTALVRVHHHARVGFALPYRGQRRLQH